MFEKTTKIDVTDRELAILEAALQTQVKILGVEAGAGPCPNRGTGRQPKSRPRSAERLCFWPKFP